MHPTQTQHGRVTDLTNVKRILALLYKWSAGWTIARIVVTLLMAIIPLIPLYLLKLLIDSLADINKLDSSFRSIIWIIAGIGLAQLVSIVLGTVGTYISFWQNEIVVDKMTDKVAEKSSNLDFGYYDSNQFFDVFQRAQQQANIRPLAVLGTCIGLGKNFITLIAIAGLLMTLHWAVVVFIFLLALPATFIRLRFSREMVELNEEQTARSRKAGLFKGMLSGKNFAMELRTFGFGPYVKQVFITLLRKLREERRDLQLRQTYIMTGLQSFEILAVLLGAGYVTYQAFHQNITLGDVAMYFALFQKGQSEIKALFGSAVAMNEHRLYLDHLFQYFDLESYVVDPPQPLPLPAPITKLSLENVTFTYPNTTTEILHGVSCHFERGKITAIVGKNGCGKTTVVKLLNRLYDPTGGHISINSSKDITNLKLRDYRSQVSTLYQDFSKYDLPVNQNILLADTYNQPSPQRIQMAAQQAEAHQFISKLPNQYQTQLGRAFWAGEELSGGEWQKLALARCLYNDADILILDEPTAHIDPVTEEKIFETIKAIAQDKILILITHRVYNLDIADHILVMDEGEVAEQGSHQELLSNGELYPKMFQVQSLEVSV